ncbi:MAG: helix-turn-helix domain-containing protein [Candidatus Dormibacteria bacterium]
MEPEGPATAETFGQTIRRLRIQRGLTQRKLAEELGIDFTYLSKVENNKGDPPAEDKVRRLAAILGCDEEDLLALAVKFPPELRTRAEQDHRFARLLRRLPEASEGDLQDVYRRLGIGPGPK